jgi:hypothetical protein
MFLSVVVGEIDWILTWHRVESDTMHKRAKKGIVCFIEFKISKKAFAYAKSGLARFMMNLTNLVPAEASALAC